MGRYNLTVSKNALRRFGAGDLRDLNGIVLCVLIPDRRGRNLAGLAAAIGKRSAVGDCLQVDGRPVCWATQLFPGLQWGHAVGQSRLERHRSLNQMHNSGMATLKRQILTMLNHEFRTPLTFVVAYSDMLNNPGDQELSKEEMLSYISGITAGADRLRNLIENFIMLVELETDSARQTYDWRKGPIASVQGIFKEAQERVKEFAVIFKKMAAGIGA
jgi:signal transduction histidine kinase